MLWLKLGWRNLWRNKRRTVIELISIAGSVFLAVWWNNLAVGTYATMIDDGVRMGSGHIGIYNNGYLEDRKTEQVITTEGIIPEISNIPEVTHVFPRLNVPGLIRSSHESRPAGFLGVDFDRETGINPVLEPKRIIRGEIPSEKDLRGILIGEELAADLDIDVGNKCVLMTQGKDGEIISSLLRVAGILRTNIREIDAGMIMMDRKMLSEILGYENSAHNISIMLNNSKQINRVLPEMSRIAHKYPGAEAYRWEEAMPELASTIQLDHAGLQITIIILFVIVGIGTINTLLMSVMERAREFGVIRAVGLRKSGIVKMVVAEGLVLALTGVFIGYILSTLAGLYTSKKGIDFSSMIDEQGIGGTIYEPIIYSTWDLTGTLVIGAGMIFIALAASVYPAYHVMKIRPSEAMRKI